MLHEILLFVRRTLLIAVLGLVALVLLHYPYSTDVTALEDQAGDQREAEEFYEEAYSPPLARLTKKLHTC